MPVLNPQYTYDDTVKKFGDFDGGSICWNQTFVYTGISNSYYNFGRIMHLDMSSLNKDYHIDLEHALEKEILTFPNDVKMVCAFWVEHVVGGYPHGAFEGDAVVQQTRIKYNGQYWDPVGSAGAVREFPYILKNSYYGPAGAQGTVFLNPYNQVKTYGCRVCINTDYMYGLGQAQEGVTKAAWLEVKIFMPVQSTENLAGQQSFSHILEGGTYFYYKETGSSVSWESDPQYIAAGYRYALDYGFKDIFHTYNVPDLAEKLSQVAPDKDPVTPNDIIEKGKPGGPTQDYDPSGPGGGGGIPDPNSDPIPFPDLPTGGAINSGAVKAFLVDPTILTSLFNKLWDVNIFDILQFQKLVDNPMDCIISLHCIPVTPGTAAGVQNIKVGSFDTQVAAPVINNQYLTIDCGSYNLKEYWGSALDYSPYTKVEIFLPFVGIKQLNVDDVMNNTSHIKYNIDILTGDCLCCIMCGQSVIYKYDGNLKQDIPLTGRTNNMGLKSALGAIGAMGAGAIGGATGGPMGGAIAMGGILSSAASVASSKIITTRSGALTGSVGLLDDFRPFFILHRPIQSLAENFRTFKGYPSNITASLGSISGYTEIEYINLQNIPNATSAEMDEIKNLLTTGVII